MGYAFISYSSRNRVLTEKIKCILENNHIECWIAPDDIPVGSKYAMVINKAIKNCSCLILLLTEETMDSQWVAKEVERAINYNKPIISIRTEAVELTDEFELYISTDQILELTALEEGSPAMQELIASVGGYCGRSAYNKQLLREELRQERKQRPAGERSAKRAGGRLWLAPGLAAIVLTVAIAAFTGLAALSEKRPRLSNPLSGGSQTEQPKEETSDTSDDSTTGQEPSADPVGNDSADQPKTTGENQIPAQFEQKITALQYTTPLALSNSTVRVKVGGYITPPAATTWTDCTIYSQDTAIVIGEGPLVKGVAKGETYIIVAVSERMGEPYRVIVE